MIFFLKLIKIIRVKMREREREREKWSTISSNAGISKNAGSKLKKYYKLWNKDCYQTTILQSF